MKPHRVLVAEDQAAFRQLLRGWLTGAGYDVRVVEDGRAAIELATSWLPDLVLMDLRMPVLDGFEASRRLRLEPATSRIPIVATTSLEHPDDVLRALSAGVNRYLRKPYGVEELLAVVEEVLFFAERRQRVAALSPRTSLRPGVVRIGAEQDQVFREVLRAVQALVPCDLLALAWRHDAGAGHVIVTDAAALDPEARAALEREGVTTADATVARLVTGERRDARGGLLALASVAALLDGQRVGALTAGRRGAPFTAEERATLAALGPMVGRAFQSCDLEPTRDLTAAAQQVEGLVAALVDDGPEAAATAHALEHAVDGLEIWTLGSLDELAGVEQVLPLVVVAPHLHRAVAKLQIERKRRGLGRLPIVRLDPSLLVAPGRPLTAWLLMGILIGVMDACRSGTLHVLRRGGGLAGLLVFRDGRIAWGAGDGAQADLLGVLEAESGVPRARLLEVVQFCRREDLSLAVGLAREGIAEPTVYQRALKAHLSYVAGELLRVDHPVLYWSNLVSVGSDAPTFDVAEIAMSGMVP